MQTKTNHKTAQFLEQAEMVEGNLSRNRRKKNKRKNKIDASVFCPVLENRGKHIFDLVENGRAECRYCSREELV